MFWLCISSVLILGSVIQLVYSAYRRTSHGTRPPRELLYLCGAALGAEAALAGGIFAGGRWSFPLLVAASETMVLGVAAAGVASHPLHLFHDGRLAATVRRAQRRSLRGGWWRFVRHPMPRPGASLVLFGTAVVSWQIAVPWVVAQHSAAVTGAYLLGTLLVAVPFWSHVYPSGPSRRLGMGARAAYVGIAAMFTNVANVVQLSGLPVVASPSPRQPAGLVGADVATTMLLTAASGLLALVLIVLVVRWLGADQEQQPPRPSGRQKSPLRPHRAQALPEASGTERRGEIVALPSRRGEPARRSIPGPAVPVGPDRRKAV
ncbi:MAG: hypothetical protein M0Z87_08180 [Actinomycetota bacterium]|nr:hypothetical protein [Actinomycetota bacterium]